MRSASEIKSALVKLRFTDRLPLAQIAKDSGCQVKQVIDAMRMDASETIQRRLDAYLDASNLHVVTKETKLLNKIQECTNELWYEYRLLSIPMRDVHKLTPRQQRIMYERMLLRLKKALQKKYEAMGTKIYVSDGVSYWRAKNKYARYSKGQGGVPGSGKVDADKNKVRNP